MTAPSKHVRKPRIHKASRQAYVVLNGRTIYLGRHDKVETQEKQHALIRRGCCSPP